MEGDHTTSLPQPLNYQRQLFFAQPSIKLLYLYICCAWDTGTTGKKIKIIGKTQTRKPTTKVGIHIFVGAQEKIVCGLQCPPVPKLCYFNKTKQRRPHYITVLENAQM
jgi:hypothetical protein